MASSSSPSIPTNCYDTALCLIPPQHLWAPIERLRILYDAAFEKWPPHINLIYPFVPLPALEEASQRIASCLQERSSTNASQTLDIRPTAAGFFKLRDTKTLHLRDDDAERSLALKKLRATILRELGSDKDGRFTPHMTVAQTDAANDDIHHFVRHKLSLLPKMQWTAQHLVILTREREASGQSMMRFWGAIDLDTARLIRDPESVGLYSDRLAAREAQQDPAPSSRETYAFSEVDGAWKAVSAETLKGPGSVPEALAIASYNVLAEFVWPPSDVRHPLLIRNLLETTARADILVLEEVTDDFLTELLAHDDIRAQYSFVSHGPPAQEDMDPLPSLLNQVILSKHPFKWSLLRLQRRHKSSAIVTFPTILSSTQDGGEPRPLVLATCHLSQGLTDGAVSAKLSELRRIVEHLREQHTHSAWVVAGDFNITTSQRTIAAAVEKKSVSSETIQLLSSLDETLGEYGLQDAWAVARCEVGESSDDFRRPKDVWGTFEGEQGATFDPSENALASALVGTGLGNRPQRYDRILVRTGNELHVGGFNMFGFPTQGPDGEALVASDHWGIRCLLRRRTAKPGSASTARVVPVERKRAQPPLRDNDAMRTLLEQLGSFPTPSEEDLRMQAFATLKSAVMEATGTAATATDQPRSRPSLVIVPVGSWALGVWSRDSDIDCMCIGPFSSRTFFSVMIPYLRASEEITILRKVEANTGTMLELKIGGVKVDLQYCGATSIAENWPDVMKRPANDPVFTLPTQTLLKLKPARDTAYLRRSIPDLAQFRLAYLLIKAWAKERGIYAAKFGYLGGVHLSSMLVRVCKMLQLQGDSVSVADIVVTFFGHYARFDFAKDMVFDPFFHKNLRYTRSFREPVCLLGWHAPVLNTALAASAPTVRTISSELKLADELLSREGASWERLLGVDGGAVEDFVPGRTGAAAFLKNFRSYVKVDVHYWGGSQEKGNQFVGWLESRCVMLLVDIDKKLSKLVTRIWPTKFVEKQATPPQHDDAEDNGPSTPEEYRGCFLIGLEWAHDDDAPPQPKTDLRAAEGTLRGVLDQFEARLRGDEKYYDAKTCWMAAQVVRASDVAGMELDRKEWGESSEYEGEDDSDMEELEEEELAQVPLPVRSKKKGKEAPSSSVPVISGGGKFRTATDVMNRLRWDAEMDAADYLVGYEDRFVGVRERRLGDWKTEQTDDEFIPQHRIVYFKRRSDGVVVWDRAKRVDLLFGSGAPWT